MIEAHVGARPFPAFELLAAARSAGLKGPDRSTRWVREDRDSR
ncbi:MAG TPA: hypothetical protein PLE61_01500 [Vicinamibacterales bacterium]|nr:hypothetical protein [Vicinamibacterales bacterium]